MLHPLMLQRRQSPRMRAMFSAGKDGAMNLEDRLAIQAVIAQYSYTWDTKDAASFANLFTEDGVWELLQAGDSHPQIHLQSRAAIGVWAAQRHQELLAGIWTFHHQSGVLFDELTTEHARTRTMILLTHQGTTESVPRLVFSGVYYDEWRKTPEGWRFARRTAQG